MIEKNGNKHTQSNGNNRHKSLYITNIQKEKGINKKRKGKRKSNAIDNRNAPIFTNCEVGRCSQS